MEFTVKVTIEVTLEATSQEEADAKIAEAIEKNGLPVLEYLEGTDGDGIIVTYDEA